MKLVASRTRKLSPEEIRASLARCQAQLDFPLQFEVAMAARRGADNSESQKQGRKGKRTMPTDKGSGVSLRVLIDAGYLTPPVALHCTYKGKDLSATILPDGRVRCGHKAYDSLSQAGGYARSTVIGTGADGKLPPTNGWIFWKLKTTDGNDLVDAVRQRFIRADGSGPRLRLVAE